MKGIRSYMGWTHIPDIDPTAGSSDDNPFAGPKLQTPGKVSVQLPTDELFCRKLAKLNLTLTDGYPSRGAEAGGLQRDQLLSTKESQLQNCQQLQFLMDFNSSICQAMAKSMEHLMDFVFVNMPNVTLFRRDSYLAYLKAGIKADTLVALRTAPLHLPTLFPDSVIKQAEEDIQL